MAVALANTSPTIVDVAKRMDPNGAMMPVVEALQQRNTFIQTMGWKVGNTDTGHRVAARNSLPSIAWVRLNDFIVASKSTVDTYEENCGRLEGLSSIDVRVAEINGGTAAFRASEDDAFLSQMANTLESAFFYESPTVNPERILGLAPRLGATASKYGAQILKADTAPVGSVQSSIWLVGWGDRSVYGISPRGQPTGLSMEDMGKVRTQDQATGNVMYKWETMFTWRVGLCVEDYRFVVRISNIDMGRINATFTAGTSDLVDIMIQAYYQIFDPTAVRLAWYCDRKVGAFLHRQAANKTANSSLTIDPAPQLGAPGVFGKPMIRCLGAPIYVTDALTNTEAIVV